MPKKQIKTYLVYGRIAVETNVEIIAASFDDAFVQAKALKLKDFVTLAGDYVDGDGLRISGLSELAEE